jgi:hypothetical protein
VAGGPLYGSSKRIFRGSEHAVFLISSFDFVVYDAALALGGLGAAARFTATKGPNEDWPAPNSAIRVTPTISL